MASEYHAMADPVPKPTEAEFELFAGNLELVESGEPFARAGGDELYAETSFYLILMSAYGYAEVFGSTDRWLGDNAASGTGKELLITPVASRRTGRPGRTRASDGSTRARRCRI
jgi:hypothetical protein